MIIINRINIPLVIKAIGISILAIGSLMLLSIPFAIYYNENTIISILASSGITSIVGFFMLFFTRNVNINKTNVIDVFVIVTFTWILMGFFGGLPFYISGNMSSLTDSMFESVSGFTTTGASILTDIESIPKSILFWRSFTQWIGGLGILVLVIAILPFIGVSEAKLYVAEISGNQSNKLHPKLKSTAQRLWYIYLFLTALQTVLLYFGGQSFFEALCHSLTTLSTGGFSPNNTSIINDNSFNQIVISIFMLLGGINFTVHYFFLTGHFKDVLRNQELRFFLIFVSVISILIAINIYQNNIFPNWGDALIHSFFQVISIITTTGFVSTDYDLWPFFGIFLLFSMFFIGGMIGSTAGGVKFTRFVVLIKNIRMGIRRTMHPNAIFHIRLNKIPIPNDIIRNAFSVFIAYIFIFCLGSIGLSFFIDDVKEVFSVSIATLGAIGPALGDYGAIGNYSMLHPIGKWICIALMIIGRLEVISVLGVVYYLFAKKTR
jgi:trk system potassium uptake protein